MHVSFVHPEFLWAWAFVLVPVLLHLFDWKRYKTVYFPHVAALRQAEQRHKRQRQLRRRLILGCRVAAIVCVVAAFARPVWHEAGADAFRTDKPYYSIYLDDSHSMSAPYGAAGGDALGAAVAEAARLVRQVPETAGIQLLTNAFSDCQQAFLTPAEALQALSGISPGPAARTLGEVAARMRTAAEEAGIPPEAVQRVYISDFQTVVFDGAPDSVARYIALTPAAYDDWHIDSVALGQAVSPVTGEGELQVWLSRSPSGGGLAERRLRYLSDGQAMPARRVALHPGERACETWPFRLTRAGYHAVELRLEPDSVPYNNHWYVSLYRPPVCRVLHVYGGRTPSVAARRLFGRDSAFSYGAVPFNRLDYADLPAADFILMEGLPAWPSALTARLDDYLRQGGRLAIVPPAPATDAAVDALDGWLRTLVGQSVYGRYTAYAPHPRQIGVETSLWRHPVWQKAVLAGGRAASELSATEPLTVYGAYELAATETPLWPDFITDYRVGNGRLYLFAAPWDEAYSTFTRHYGFVVCLLGMAEEGGGLRPLYVADRRAGYGLPTARRGQAFDFKGLRLVPTGVGEAAVAADTQAIPAKVGAVAGAYRLYGLETLPSGHYRLTDASGIDLDLLALNPPASESWQSYRRPTASDTAVAAVDTVSEPLEKPLKKGAISARSSVPLWKILLIFALALMGVEAWLLYASSPPRPKA